MNVRIISILTLVFLLIEVALVNFVDRPVSEYLRQVDTDHPAMINFFRDFTNLGKSKWYLWPSGIALILCVVLRHLRLAPLHTSVFLSRVENALLFLFISVAASGIVTDIIKPLLGRARRSDWHAIIFMGFILFRQMRSGSRCRRVMQQRRLRWLGFVRGCGLAGSLYG